MEDTPPTQGEVICRRRRRASAFDDGGFGATTTTTQTTTTDVNTVDLEKEEGARQITTKTIITTVVTTTVITQRGFPSISPCKEEASESQRGLEEEEEDGAAGATKSAPASAFKRLNRRGRPLGSRDRRHAMFRNGEEATATAIARSPSSRGRRHRHRCYYLACNGQDEEGAEEDEEEEGDGGEAGGILSHGHNRGLNQTRCKLELLKIMLYSKNFSDGWEVDDSIRFLFAHTHAFKEWVGAFRKVDSLAHQMRIWLRRDIIPLVEGSCFFTHSLDPAHHCCQGGHHRRPSVDYGGSLNSTRHRESMKNLMRAAIEWIDGGARLDFFATKKQRDESPAYNPITRDALNDDDEGWIKEGHTIWRNQRRLDSMRVVVAVSSASSPCSAFSGSSASSPLSLMDSSTCASASITPQQMPRAKTTVIDMVVVPSCLAAAPVGPGSAEAFALRQYQLLFERRRNREERDMMAAIANPPAANEGRGADPQVSSPSPSMRYYDENYGGEQPATPLPPSIGAKRKAFKPKAKGKRRSRRKGAATTATTTPTTASSPEYDDEEEAAFVRSMRDLL